MSNPILDYIFMRKGGIRAKTPAEAFLAAYLITATANKKRFKDTNQTDTKRGKLAIKEFYNKKSSDKNTKKIRKILESFKKKLKSELKNDDYLLSKSTKEFFKLSEIDSNSYRNLTDVALLSQYRNFDINSIKNEFRRYNSKHPGVIDKKLMEKIGEGEKETIDKLQSKRLMERVCRRLFEKKNTSNEKFTVLTSHNGDDYIDHIYKLNDKIYRIIVGKKEAVATKGFSWIDKKLLGDIGEIIKLEEKNGKYKLTKIAQGKTSEKYADTKSGSNKKEFHFRYKIYLGGHTFKPIINPSYLLDPAVKQAILKHFGYTAPEQLGEGGYGTAYVDKEATKNGIIRVIKICISDEIGIKKEWKGVNTAYKIFDKIKNLDSDTKKLREEFYKNESIVFNKNKAMGQLSEIEGYENAEESYWYCISTSEYRTGGEASSVPEEDRELFKNDNKALWVELQAFAKDVLNGLSIFHKRGTAHLDVKPANIFKTKTSGKDVGPKYKYAIADHTMAFNKADFNKKFSEKNKTTTNQDFIKSYTTSLNCGTPGYMAPENPYKNQKESNYVLPEDYDPCIADSYSAGISIIDYTCKLLNIENKDFSKKLKEKNINGLYQKFSPFIYGLIKKDWKSRVSCTDALNSSFITAKIQ